VETAGKIVLLVGIGLVAAGALLLLLSRLGVDRLPGSFVWRHGNVTVYAPIGLMILVSVVLTIVLNVFLRR
jgi:multisubunit Na+/H+ antiporter MnhG subunit